MAKTLPKGKEICGPCTYKWMNIIDGVPDFICSLECEDDDFSSKSSE